MSTLKYVKFEKVSIKNHSEFNEAWVTCPHIPAASGSMSVPLSPNFGILAQRSAPGTTPLPPRAASQ